MNAVSDLFDYSNIKVQGDSHVKLYMQNLLLQVILRGKMLLSESSRKKMARQKTISIDDLGDVLEKEGVEIEKIINSGNYIKIEVVYNPPFSLVEIPFNNFGKKQAELLLNKTEGNYRNKVDFWQGRR